MSNKQKVWAASGVLLAFVLLIVLSLRPIHHNGIINDGKEPETQGLSLVRFGGDDKLNSLLAPPQLAAAKRDMSAYIRTKFGPKIYTATIDNTVIRDDGSIAMKVTARSKRFDPVIYSNDAQFIFKVPADNYQTATPQSAIINQYSGGY